MAAVEQRCAVKHHQIILSCAMQLLVNKPLSINLTKSAQKVHCTTSELPFQILTFQIYPTKVLSDPSSSSSSSSSDAASMHPYHQSFDHTIFIPIIIIINISINYTVIITLRCTTTAILSLLRCTTRWPRPPASSKRVQKHWTDSFVTTQSQWCWVPVVNIT